MHLQDNGKAALLQVSARAVSLALRFMNDWQTISHPERLLFICQFKRGELAGSLLILRPAGAKSSCMPIR